MRWYCDLRTGVTYILAVLGSHLSTSVVSARLLEGPRYEALAKEADEDRGGIECT